MDMLESDIPTEVPPVELTFRSPERSPELLEPAPVPRLLPPSTAEYSPPEVGPILATLPPDEEEPMLPELVPLLSWEPPDESATSRLESPVGDPTGHGGSCASETSGLAE